MHKLTVTEAKSIARALTDALQRSPEFRYIHRLHCVLLVARGLSCYEVARLFGENPRTIHRWVHAVDRLGVARLADQPRRGRSRALANEDRQSLRRSLATGPSSMGYRGAVWTGRLLQTHLAQAYELHLSIRQCQRLMCGLRRENALMPASDPYATSLQCACCPVAATVAASDRASSEPVVRD